MRYIVISYDKTSVCVQRLKVGQCPASSLQREVLCEGSSFGDVVKALESAFAEEMEAE